MFCYHVPQGFSLENDADVAKLAAAGVTEVACDEEELVMEVGTTREGLAALRKKLDAAGIRVTTCHPPFGSYNDEFSTIHQPGPKLDEELDYMREFILRCGILGVRAIPLHTGGAMLARAQDWEVQLARDYVNALLPAARAAGVKIAVENTNHAQPLEWYPGMQEKVPLDRNIWYHDDPKCVRAFVQSFDDEMVGICYDTGHAHLQGAHRTMEDMALYKGRIVLYHLHDGDGAWSDQHIQPGYGNCDWKALFDSIREQGYDDVPLYVEAGPRFGDMLLMVREMDAIWDGRVTVLPGGYLAKDEDTGHVLVKEVAQHG